MELYRMPQLEKTSAYPEHVQYEQTSTPLGRSPVNKFGPVTGTDILTTSSAWSAIIHRPAEDSEPDELPSTVDMDAIKEPLTPMPAPVMTPKPEPPEPSESSSGSDSEADSSSDSGGESNTDSEDGSGSGSCSWSGSDCGSGSERKVTTMAVPHSKTRSSCSSGSSGSQRSDSDHSIHTNKHFSIRETNFDQGGLKLKISALKVPKKTPVREETSSSSSSDERDNSSSDEEADKSSDASHTSPKLPRKHISEQEPCKTTQETTPTTVVRTSPAKEEEEKRKKRFVEEKKESISNKKCPSSPEVKPTNSITKLVKEETRNSVRGSIRLANLKTELKLKSPNKVNRISDPDKKPVSAIKKTSPIKNTDKILPSTPPTGASRLRSFRKKPKSEVEQERSSPKVISGGADSCDSDDEDDDEADEQEGEGKSDDISQLAQQLGEPETAIPISEQLQVINQEDLAAILPDVVGFDGFEDVSSGECGGRSASGKSGAPPRPAQESSSDTELLPEQEQIVSEAIKRIDLDSDGPADKEELGHQSSSTGEDDDHDEVGYSSTLLQQFVEKTEQLSQKSQKGSPPGTSAGTGAGQAARRRRGRPPKNNSAIVPPADHHNRLVMPELEAYMRLDCSVSNVSPDSGIQSVAGSPSHQCSPAWHPPAHSPVPQPSDHHHQQHDKPKQHSEKISKLYATTVDFLGEIGGKRGPGRPKGSGRRKRRRLIHPINPDLLMNKDELRRARDVLKVPPFYRHAPHHKTVVNMVESNEELPRLPGMIPGKRGPGRPKKTPPTLEPILPLSSSKVRKTGGNDSSLKSSGSLLHDICERVSKRLDIPLPIARLPKPIYEKSGPSGYKHTLLETKIHPKYKSLGVTLEKRKKGRRKMIMQSRSLALSKGLMKVRQHKHKKRKKLKRTVSALDPSFVIDLEKLALDFKKMCRINTEALPTKNTDTSSVLPESIFRVKRIVKKRKGSERDRDSGPEVEVIKEKIPSGTSSSTITTSVLKRRPKKNAVEATKNRDRPETNNEQRLPLKKRHYHISTAPVPPTTETGQFPKQDVVQEAVKQPSTKSVIVSISEKTSDKPPVLGNKSGSGGTKATQAPLTKSDNKSKGDHRNSIDEAIEATITRYAHESRSVIVTPKKRHRLEMEKKGSGTSPMLRNLSGSKNEFVPVANPQPTKRVSSRSSSTNNQSLPRTVSPSPTPSQAKRSTSRGTSKPDAPVAPRQRSRSRGSSTNTPEAATPTTLAATQPVPKRANTRSGDSNTQTVVLSKRTSRATAAAEEKAASAPTVTSATQAVLNKRAAAREKAALIASTETKSTNSTKQILQHVGMLSTRSAAKITPNAPLITPIPPPSENTSKSQRSRSNKPPEGVFEPSSKADELMSLVAIPPPAVNDMDTVLSPVLTHLTDKLKGLETIDALPNSIIKLDESHNGRNRPKRSNDSSGDEEKKLKKRKVIRDIRVHVTKLSPSDLVLKKVMGVVKAKIRRRNRINRTGFPVKKKKKKKPVEIIPNTTLSLDIHCNEKESVVEPKLPDTKANLLDLPAPILCMKKIDDFKVKTEKDAVTDEAKPSNQRIEKTEETLPLSQRIKITEDTNTVNTRTFKKLEITKTDKNPGNNKSEDNVNIEPIKVEPRKSSRRLMILKARQRVEASKRRKRKPNLLLVQGVIPREKRSPSPEFPPPSPLEINPPEIRLLPSKRLRRSRDDGDRDDSDADSTRSRKKHPPRWRKKYLTAGLFSDCYKEDEPRKNTDVCKSRLTYNPAEHRHGLLPPPYYCGKWVRQRKIHFQLPHDLWWLHTNNQLPGRDIVPSWNFRKIRTNVYYDVKPVLSYEAQACSCKAESEGECEERGCGEDCINRMIYTECSPQQCPSRERCSNQRIQRHEWAPGLDKFMTKDKGWGVKTKYPIKTGEFILEYVGEVVSEKEFKNRMASRYQHDTHHYCLNLDGGLVIDGHRMGGDGRFVNHSCEPNCEMQKWSVNGLFRMALFALRDIEPHEELTYDYNFSLFNPAEGQKCKCGSKNCRGVIGGKSQRVAINNNNNTSAVGVQEKPSRKPRKARKSAKCRKKQETQPKPTVGATPTAAVLVRERENKELSHEAIVARLNHLLPLKSLAPQQRAFVLQTRLFLPRNLEKVKQLREKLKKLAERGGSCIAVEVPVTPSVSAGPAPVKETDVFLSQLNAISTPRNIRTRRLAQAQDNPEMTKTARLAHIFKHLYNSVVQAKEEDGELLATPLVTLPSKRKLPQYFQRVTEPIDLISIEQNIFTGVYKTVESFDQDMCRLFSNNVRFYGRTTDIGIAATRLRKIYCVAKFDFIDQLKEILGDSIPATFLPEQEDPGAEEEDVIRCICGMFRDEGLMIQCERCLVWQHCDCVKADTDADKYLCERCCPRPVDLEIPLEVTPDYATEGQKHFMTLLRGDLQLRQGDTVYVLRDIPNEETGSETIPPSKHTYKTIKNVKYSDCDIFRIERLWKDEKGDRFAFGHHYLRPHETFHEPTRKFFPNELMRIPLYEVVPLDLIMGHCYVLDVNTFCKGRPVGADSQHIYICEYRVDKYARLFAKLAKSKTPPVCLKNYAFEKYDQRLRITRTYTPHGSPVKGSSVSRGRGGRSAQDSEDHGPTHQTHGPAHAHTEDEELPLARVRDTALASKRAQQKASLNALLLRLLARLPSKQPLDVSYLLEPGRRHRKRPTILSP